VKKSEAIELLRRRGVVVLTDTEGAGESFVFAVAGERVRGSWWGHAKGHDIFNLAGAVVASGEAILVKLVRGKETFVHRALWPALVRVVTDEGWRKPRIAALSKAARELLKAVEKTPPLRLDEYAAKTGVSSKVERKALNEARRELEKALLVRAHNIHTDSGAHTDVLQPWTLWAAREKLEAAAPELSLDEALAALKAACGQVPTTLDSGKVSGRRR
jgi:hypothetical protein